MTTISDNESSSWEASELARLGAQALEARKYREAHNLLKEALERDRTPGNLSLFALALAHYTGDTRTATALCVEGLKKEPDNPEHYLRFGLINLIAGKRRQTIRALDLGQRAGSNEEIAQLLQILGTRKRPVFPFLSRDNPLNKFFGKMRSSWARAG